VSETLNLEWQGPFAFVRTEGLPYLYDERTLRRGVYLWALPHQDGYLVNYVGKADGIIADRIWDDMQYSLQGSDKHVVDPLLFEQGIRKVISRRPHENFESLLEGVRQTYCCLRAFIAPVTDTRWRPRDVEAGLIRTLRNSPRDVADFLANQRGERHSEVPFQVIMSSPVRFHGIGPVVDC
jgi:hypothetical protein